MRNGRPESNLEKSHLELAGYSNGGMRDSLADGITKRGVCRSNKRIRTALRVGSLSSKEIDSIPSHLRNHPGTYDDTIKIEENRLAKDLGMDLPNDEEILQKYPPNNGEEFGSAYFYSEIERKKKFAPIPDSVRCPCDRCGGNPVQLPHLQQHLPVPVAPVQAPEIEELPPAPSSSYPAIAPTVQHPYYQQQPPTHGYYGYYGHPGHMYPPYMYSYPAPEPKRTAAKERQACCPTYKDKFLLVEGNRKRGAPAHCLDCPVGQEIRKKRKIARYGSM